MRRFRDAVAWRARPAGRGAARRPGARAMRPDRPGRILLVRLFLAQRFERPEDGLRRRDDVLARQGRPRRGHAGDRPRELPVLRHRRKKRAGRPRARMAQGAQPGLARRAEVVPRGPGVGQRRLAGAGKQGQRRRRRQDRRGLRASAAQQRRRGRRGECGLPLAPALERTARALLPIGGAGARGRAQADGRSARGSLCRRDAERPFAGRRAKPWLARLSRQGFRRCGRVVRPRPRLGARRRSRRQDL